MPADELIWLMRHTVPVPGERGAAAESWLNLLADAGLSPKEARREVERARRIWDDYLRRARDGAPLR